MKRVIGLILFGLGIFLLILAPMFRFYVGPKAAVAPLDQYTESTGVGTVIKQLDIAKFGAGEIVYKAENFPMKQTRYTRGDVNASEQDPAKSDNLAVYDTFQRVNNTDNNELVNASSSRYAFGRTNSELNNCCGANASGKQVQFSGIMPLKWPFFLKQQAYDIWDDLTQGTIPAQFVAEEDHAGVKTYKFQQNLPPTAVPGTNKVKDKTYQQYSTAAITTWVEPETGQIVDSSQNAKVTIRDTAEPTKDVAIALEYTAHGDPSFVEKSAKDINSKASQLSLVMNTLPIVCLIAGIVLALIGFLLGRSKDDQNSGGASAPAQGPPATV